MCCCQALLKQTNVFSTRPAIFAEPGKPPYCLSLQTSTVYLTPLAILAVFFRKTDWYISCLFSARCTTNNLPASVHTPLCALILEDKPHLSTVPPDSLKSVILLFYFPNITGKNTWVSLHDRNMDFISITLKKSSRFIHGNTQCFPWGLGFF